MNDKTQQDKSLFMTRLMTPDMSNFSGKVHGGTILKLLDEAAFTCASRYCKTYVVTKSLDQVVFKTATRRHKFVEIDFLKANSLRLIPSEIDIAFYLIHSMSNSAKEFHILEERCAFNFKRALEKTSVKQVIYLSGITNDTKLSKHLLSRKIITEHFMILSK